MLVQSRAIVLHTTKYADQRYIVELLTERDGFLSFTRRINTTRRGVSSRTQLQPLSLLEISYDDRPTQTLKSLKHSEIIPFRSILYNPIKSSIILFLAEFLRNALKKEPSSTLLFDYIYQSIEWLDTNSEGFSNFHLVFLLRLTRFFGFSPNAEVYKRGHYFDLLNGCFCAKAPYHIHYILPEEAQTLPTIIKMNFANMHLFRLNRIQRSRILDLLIEYYRLHIPNFPELKSLAIFKEIFS